MAELVSRENKDKARNMLIKIAVMGAGYATIGKQQDDGGIKGSVRIDLNPYQPFQDFITDLIKRYPDKSRYGRDINIKVSSFRGYRAISLERDADPHHYRYSSSTTPVDINLNRTEGSREAAYYRYTLPESAVRALIKGVDKFYPQVINLYNDFNRSIFGPAVDKAIDDKIAAEEAEAERKRAEEEKISKYIRFNTFDGPEASAKKKEQVFGPHYKELDIYGRSSDPDALSWDLFKKKYEDEIPDMDQADFYIKEANGSFFDAKFYHDYGYYPSSDEVEEVADWVAV